MKVDRTRADKLPLAFAFLVAFSLSGSLFSRLTRLDPGPIAPVTSLLTLGVGVAAVFGAYVREVPRAYLRLIGAFALGATSEIVGLATGFPFGRYVYTGAWWPTLGIPGVGLFPIALPFAWLLMAGASVLGVRGRRLGYPWVSCVAGGLLAALVDLLMEPVMTGPLGYWRWLRPGPLPGGAPIANFLGWWAVATLAGAILTFGAQTVERRTPRRVLVGFVVLIVGLGLIGTP